MKILQNKRIIQEHNRIYGTEWQYNLLTYNNLQHDYLTITYKILKSKYEVKTKDRLMIKAPEKLFDTLEEALKWCDSAIKDKISLT